MSERIARSGDHDRTAALALLTPRERECLRLVYERRTTKEIARDLALSPGTVFRYIKDAQTKLDAPNRRVAAEMVHHFEAVGRPPMEMGGSGDWVEPSGEPAPSEGHSLLPETTSWLPIRKRGSQHNDLSPSTRIAWVFAIAFALAIGFGMLATGAHVVSILLGAWFS